MKKQFILPLAVMLASAIIVYGHSDATHLTGTITAIEGDHIQIKDQQGKSIMVMLGKTTRYLKADKVLTKSELKVGTGVLIHAKMDEKMEMYAAEAVTIGLTTTAAATQDKAKAK